MPRKKPTSVNEGYVEKGDEIWCGSASNIHRTATAILERVLDSDLVRVSCIGPDAVNCGVKSIITARHMIGETHDLNIVPWFSVVKDDENNERTRIVFEITAFVV